MFIETSAKDGFNIKLLFRRLATALPSLESNGAGPSTEQTPQVIKPDLLKRGFELVNEKGYEVTDDVSIVEFMGERVQITEGSYVNIKVTTPEDMFIAERLLTEQ